MNQLATKIARLLCNNANGSFFEDEIRYGLEVTLGALFQIAIIIATALLLGIGKEVLATLSVAALYRRFTGGAHCQAYYRCTIVSLVTYILLGYISKYIPVYYLPGYILFLMVFSILIVYYRVPVDSPTKTITDETQKKRLKRKSYLILLLLLAAIIITGYFIGQKLLAICFLLGLFWQNLTLLRLGHAYIAIWDRFFTSIEKILVGEEVMRC